MKTLIIYASKYGCVADCATDLKSKLSGDVTLVDVKKMDKDLDLDNFETIIIGGSVYIGNIAKELKSFCRGNLELLCRKKLGLFLCCGQVDQANEFFENNFQLRLLKHAQITECFGGEARPEKMNLVDSSLLKAVTKGDFSSFEILDKNIEKFAEAFN